MINGSAFSFIIALLCYTIVSIYFVRAFIEASNRLSTTVTNNNKPQGNALPHKAIISLLIIGMLFHTYNLYGHMFTQYGISFSVFNVISLTSLIMLGFSLLFSLYRPIIVLNILAAPIAIFGLLVGYIAPYTLSVPMSTTVGANLSTSMQLHIIFSIGAHSVLFMAAVQAILLHLQNKELKHKTKTRLWVRLLPALQAMERLLFDMIVMGFVMLSVALLLGFVGVDNLLAQHLVHKTVFSVIAWVLFAGLIFGHYRFGWRGKLAANMTLWGFALLATGFIGTKFVLQIILGK